MPFFDQHVHSDSSIDCHFSMEAMTKAAIARGLSSVTFTDHCDLIYFDKANVPDPRCYPLWSGCRDAYNRVQDMYGSEIELHIGMELGEINQDPETAAKCYATEGLDLVLGSIHAVRDHADFFLMDYRDQDEAVALVSQYLDESIEMARLGFFDVMAHLGYTIRYMAPYGIDVDFRQFEDKLRTLFAVLIEEERGLELNTSGLRQGARTTFPTEFIMSLYRDCGGEIVTLGSDAHTPDDIGAHFEEGIALLKRIGFTKLAHYRAHQPHFIDIEGDLI